MRISMFLSGISLRVVASILLMAAGPAPSFANGPEAQDTVCLTEFRLNLSKAVKEQLFVPDSDAVFVTFNEGSPAIQLTRGPQHIYSAILMSTDSGTLLHYRFRINQNLYETIFRAAVTKPGQQTLYHWWNDDPLNITTFRVNMKFMHQAGLFDPAADSVCISGTFTPGHSAITLTRERETDFYSISFALEPGTVHQFRYRINSDSSALEMPGKPERIFRVPGSYLTLAHDFSNINPATRPMEFRCNMSYYIRAGKFSPAGEYLDVAGNFNNWGGFDAMFDRNGDSVYTVEIFPDTAWFRQPFEFRYRINGEWELAELQGKPNRMYQFRDTLNQGPNLFSAFFNNLDPSVPTPPFALHAGIDGWLIYRKTISGYYTYENINGIPEGQSVYQWYRCDNPEGTGAVLINSANRINYVIDTLDIGKWLIFEVTPKALSGDSATGKPLRVISSGSISAWDVGLTEHPALQLHVYPNPFTNLIRITGNQIITDLSLINQFGQTVSRYRGTGTLAEMMIDAGGLPPGLYMLRAADAKGATAVVRLIKR